MISHLVSFLFAWYIIGLESSRRHYHTEESETLVLVLWMSGQFKEPAEFGTN